MASPSSFATSMVVSDSVFSVKKTNILLDDLNYLLWRQQVIVANVPVSAKIVTYQQVASNVDNIEPPAYRPSLAAGAPYGRDCSRSLRIQCQFCGIGHLIVDATISLMQPIKLLVINLFCKRIFSVHAPASPATILSSSPQAYVATPKTVGGNAWHLGSSATHHLMHLNASMGESASYSDPCKVYVGNGYALPVLSTGQSSLIMCTVYAVFIACFSMYKFTKENKVLSEFLPTECQVRDLRTQEVLLC
ncbi:hypothetical protein GOBAR_AA00611 [Gossypium barbadense]|uniref:Retrotransposon Copia-like N-terminal domain-containing protein n=1 Tax=Gossypium barbadense TaxID=3634 RepID=A0A2P5YWK3_GOSBA|nr:hypothetical protein GOBAR_AA00611 [Gossypium barbadense]